jgi:hypothetical protein
MHAVAGFTDPRLRAGNGPFFPLTSFSRFFTLLKICDLFKGISPPAARSGSDRRLRFPPGPGPGGGRLFSVRGTVLTGSLDGRNPGGRTRLGESVQAYQPDSEAVNAIARLGKSVRIRPLSEPGSGRRRDGRAFIKTLETAGNTAIIVEWVGVSRDLKEPLKPLRAYSVDDVRPSSTGRTARKKAGSWERPGKSGSRPGRSSRRPSVSGADLNLFPPYAAFPSAIDCTPCHRPAGRE